MNIRGIILGLFFLAVTGWPAAAAAFDLKGGKGPLRLEDYGLPGKLLIMERDNEGKRTGSQEKSARTTGMNTDFGKHRLSFSYHGGESEERFNSSPAKIFNGRSFSLSEEIARQFDYGVYDFIYQYDVANFQNFFGGFTLGVVGQLKLMEGQNDPHSERQRREDFTSIPLVGLDLQMGILGDLLQGRFRAAGMGSNQGNIFDGQAELALSPYPFLGIYGGYRFFVVNLETEENRIDYDSSGPYLGITLSF